LQSKSLQKLGKEGGRGTSGERSATAMCCAGVVLLHCRLTSMRDGLKQIALFSPALRRTETKRLRAGKVTFSFPKLGMETRAFFFFLNDDSCMKPTLCC